MIYLFNKNIVKLMNRNEIIVVAENCPLAELKTPLLHPFVLHSLQEPVSLQRVA